MIAKKDYFGGIYNINSFRGVTSFVPATTELIFPSFYSRNPMKKSNVLIYIDENAIDSERDSTRYLALEMQKDPYFDIVLSTKPDASLAENADVVITRFDPPIKESFLKQLKRYNNGERLFVNTPKSQLYFSNKKYLEDIAGEHPELFPQPQVYATSPEEAVKFLKEYDEKEFVSKPVRGFGGEGIVRVNPKNSQKDLGRFIESLFEQCPEGIILQRFIDNIADYGDKRIQVIDGIPIGALLRKPGKGEFRCNVKKGGSMESSSVTEGDEYILNCITDLLKEKEVYWAGIDIVGPYLGEINAVSPGLLYAIDEFNGGVHSENSLVRFIAEDIKKEVQDRYIQHTFQRLE